MLYRVAFLVTIVNIMDYNYYIEAYIIYFCHTMLRYESHSLGRGGYMTVSRVNNYQVKELRTHSVYSNLIFIMGRLNRTFTVLLAGAIVCALGFLGYIMATPKLEEQFTEFYILDRNGRTNSYPVEFITNDSQVTQVKYSDGVAEHTTCAYIRIGIVNYENRQVQYSVSVRSDGKPVIIYPAGQQVQVLGPLVLAHGEKWEQDIGFALLTTGDDQKVEFIMEKDDVQNADTLHLWVDVLKEG